MHEATYSAQEILLYLQQCVSLFYLMEYNFSLLISQTKDGDVHKYYILIILLFMSISTGHLQVCQFTAQCRFYIVGDIQQFDIATIVGTV